MVVLTSPIAGSDGTILGYVGAVEDITNLKQAEAEMLKSLERERELNNLKSRFITLTSHEFRTPLAVISSSAGILKTFGAKLSKEKTLEHLNTIQTYIKHTTSLLDDILLLDRVEDGRLTFNPELTNLPNFCQSITDDMKAFAGAGAAFPQGNREIRFSHCSCQRSDASDAVTTRIDPKLLQQILTNLLSNALKYSPAGSPVNFNLSLEQEVAIFQVTDRGIGIPEEDRDRIFDAFHRAQNVGTIQGTGLGLSIVKRCLELHGGQISFETQVDGGTTFTVTLPCDWF